MMEFFPKERRREPRLILHFPVAYKTNNLFSNSQFQNKMSRDMSNFGIRVVSDNFVASNTYVSLRINIASKVVDTIARVVWSNRVPHSDTYHIGLEFRELDNPKKTFLRNLLNYIKTTVN